MDTTEWENYGQKSGNEKCRDCMVHCGYEATAVDHTFSSLKGVRRDGGGHPHRQAVGGAAHDARGLGARDRRLPLAPRGGRVRLRLPRQHHDREDGRHRDGRLHLQPQRRRCPSPSSSTSTSRETGRSPLPYRDIATIKFTGKDTAAGNSWKAWVERKERGKGAPGRGVRRRPVRAAILILTAVELEARALARALDLPPLPSLPFPAFGRGHAARRSRRPRVPAFSRPLARPRRRPRPPLGRSRPAYAAASIPASRRGRSRPARERARRSGERGSHVSTAITGAARRGAAGVHAARLAMASSSQSWRRPKPRRRCRAATGAVAVDMESAVILEAAAAARLPVPGGSRRVRRRSRDAARAS